MKFCFNFLISSDNFSLVYVAFDDMGMHLVRIILLQRDYIGGISSAYIICFGRYPELSSVWKFTITVLIPMYKGPIFIVYI